MAAICKILYNVVVSIMNYYLTSNETNTLFLYCNKFKI